MPPPAGDLVGRPSPPHSFLASAHHDQIMPSLPSSLRRHLSALIAAVGIAVLAGAGVLIGVLTTGGSTRTISATSPTTAPAATAPATTLPAAPSGVATPGTGGSGKKAHHMPHVRGTVDTITATQWTVTTTKGTTYTLTISPTTTFGTPKAPVAASSFSVGQTVTAFGTRTGTTLTATRIVATPAPAGATAPTTSPTTTPAG